MSEPIHIISLGAGVQSSTMALMAAHGEITPMPKCAIFADTQDEPQSVYRWLSWLEKQLPFPVVRVTAGKLSDAITTAKPRKDGKGNWSRAGIPSYDANADGSDGHGLRQCTWSFKLEPLDKAARSTIGATVLRQWRTKHKDALRSIREHEKTMRAAGVKARGRAEEWEECWEDALVEQWIGISLDEAHRMKTPRHPWQSFRYPLIDLRMRRHDCLLWMNRNGYPKPPRSACVYCPYHSDAEWRRLRDEEPKEFEKAVRIEKLYQVTRMTTLKRLGMPYLHASRVPLDQVDFSTDEDHGQQVMFGNECEGMCGV